MHEAIADGDDLRCERMQIRIDTARREQFVENALRVACACSAPDFAQPTSKFSISDPALMTSSAEGAGGIG